MAIDLSTLYTQVSLCSTINQSMTTLFDGLIALIEDQPADLAVALRALTTHPDDENQQIAWVDLLREAITRNTSHVKVKQNDPLIDLVRSALEMKPNAKAARVASIQLAVTQPELDKVEAAVGAQIAAMTTTIAEIEAKTDKLVALQAGVEASTEDLDRVTSLAAAKAALEAEVAAKQKRIDELEAAQAAVAEAVP